MKFYKRYYTLLKCPEARILICFLLPCVQLLHLFYFTFISSFIRSSLLKYSREFSAIIFSIFTFYKIQQLVFYVISSKVFFKENLALD